MCICMLMHKRGLFPRTRNASVKQREFSEIWQNKLKISTFKCVLDAVMPWQKERGFISAALHPRRCFVSFLPLPQF